MSGMYVLSHRWIRRAVRVVAVPTALLCAVPSAGRAQIETAPPPPGATTQTMPASTRYQLGGFRKWLFGRQYREVWEVPIEVPVLNLDSVGGGLTPLRTGGFGQSVSLHFTGLDGRRYVVRSVDKDPTKRLVPELHDTFIEKIIQDQVSALHPSAALVADAIMDATGVLHTSHSLVVIPDDARLGEFREEFAGMMGMLVLHPDEGPDNVPGFAGSRQVSGSEAMFESLEEGPCSRADARAFLKARLVDMILGDRDRHEGQWRWAAFPQGGCRVWRPIPEDRDQAFVDFDGVVMWATRRSRPQQIRFGARFPSVVGLTFNAWEVDRQLLSELDRGVWDSLATVVQSELTDAVIDDAVLRMPAEHYALSGQFVVTSLKGRRDQLLELAGRYFDLLTTRSDVHATDVDEHAEIIHAQNGDVRVTIGVWDGSADRTGVEPYFDRTFHRSETKEVRLYLHGGDDRAVVIGDGGGIVVRLIGGGGDDQLINESSLGGRFNRFYDSRGDNEFLKGAGARVNERPFKRPPSKDLAHQFGLDWGGRSMTLPFLFYTPDLGILFGVKSNVERYGFRKVPYTSKYAINVGFSTKAVEPIVAFDSWHRAAVAGLDARTHASWSGLEVLNYFGQGNETPGDEPSTFYKVEQRQVEVSTALEWRIVKAPLSRRSDAEEDNVPTPAITGEPVNDPVSLDFGPVMKFSNTPLEANADRFIARDSALYGGGSFGEVGFRTGLTIDTRDAVVHPRKGIYIRMAGSIYPGVWDVQSTFGEVHGEAGTYLTAPIPAEPTLAIRVGGKKLVGTFPFFESAFIGGPSTVRGYRQNRFAGDGSVYGNAELRVRFSRVRLLVPIGIGAFGGADVGRVLYENDPASADKIHTAFGGGLWFAFIDRRGTATAGIMSGDDITGLYLQTGFAF